MVSEKAILNRIRWDDEDKIYTKNNRKQAFLNLPLISMSIAGVGKMFVRRATFENNIAAEGRTR